MRFGGIARLFGRAGLARLRTAHVCVVGLGGVGTWVGEALARSGVGALTLVDLDDVCVTNVNRQIHALDGTIGHPKVEAMAARVRAINPHARVCPVAAFFTRENAAGLLATPFAHVVDAIDDVPNKSLLIAACRERGIPMLTCGGSGGRQSGLGIQVTDLTRARHDRLLRQLRRHLRREHGFPKEREREFGVPAVCLGAPPVYPWSDGRVGDRKESGTELKLDCASGFGTATFVTGALGFAAAEYVVRAIVREERT